MSELADVALPVPCPHCGNRARETVARLEQNPMLPCSKCDTPIDGSQVLRAAKLYFEDLQSRVKESE